MPHVYADRLSPAKRAALTRAANAAARVALGQSAASRGALSAGRKAALTRQGRNECARNHRACFTGFDLIGSYAMTHGVASIAQEKVGIFTVGRFERSDRFCAVIFMRRDRVPASGQFATADAREAFIAEQTKSRA